jgi:NADPH-ferrihemoprotein reductase
MENLVQFLPIIVGVVVVLVVVVLKSRGGKKDKTELSSASTTAGNGKANIEIDSPVQPIYGPLHIFFGTQTGAAQNYSKILSEEATKAGFDPRVVDLADFAPDFFKDVKIAIFAVSTHGEGEPPENTKTFNEYLIDAARTGQEFKGLKFTVFALGNKQYQFYCAQGRRVDEYVSKLGGERIYKLGEGDDNENLEDDFNAWKEGIWAELTKFAQVEPAPTQGLTRSRSIAQEGALPFVINVDGGLKEIDLETYDANNDGKEYDFQIKQYLLGSNANLSSIRELRQKTHDGSTLHVEIDGKQSGVHYKTAQNIAVWVENSSEIVEKVAQILDLNLSDVFSLEQNPDVASKGKFKHPIPSPISVKTYLTRFCDLQSALRKRQLKDLAQFCNNEDNKNKLIFLSGNEGKTEYDVQINSRMLGLFDVIEEFGIKVPLEQLIQIANPILPRLYTIASSSKKHPDSVHLCVSILADKLPNGKSKIGLASAYFTRQYNLQLAGKATTKTRVHVRDSTFILPSGVSVPIIMVGPGAGIAPFKGFLDERAHLVGAGGENPYGDMTLYFGCRGSEWDYLYREELTQYHSSGNTKNYYVAFSRELEQKVYVQDLVIKNKEEIANSLFEQNGIFYICGSMAMGKAVIAKLSEIAANFYKIDAAEGHKKVEELEKSKRIIKELWG